MSCAAEPTRSSSWRATLPGPSACLWPTWWRASWRTCTRCTRCPRWSRWGASRARCHFLLRVCFPPWLTPTWLHHLAGHARREGRGLPQRPLRPGQQRPHRRRSHDAEARRGEAVGEERRDPVGRAEGADPVKSVPLKSKAPRCAADSRLINPPPPKRAAGTSWNISKRSFSS